MSRDHTKLKVFELADGCARRTTRDFLHFVTLSLGSASEVRYQLTIAQRLDLMDDEIASALHRRYDELVRGLQALANSLEEKS